MNYIKAFSEKVKEWHEAHRDDVEPDVGFLLDGYTPEAIASLRSPLTDGIQDEAKVRVGIDPKKKLSM